MKLTTSELKDIEMFLGTLATCDYLGVHPTLPEEKINRLSQIQFDIQNYLRSNPS
jgi:hypothetical protein